MPSPNTDHRSFTMSTDELRRREKAFGRLGVSTILAFAASSADLFAAHSTALLGAVALLAVLFIASRVWLAAGNRRYAHTTWRVGPQMLERSDSRSVREYQLRSIQRTVVKRTTAGTIREIKLSLEDGSAVYVNGLEDAESFWSCLKSASTGASEASLREPIDYDHPLFYVVLGCVIGAATSLVMRVGVFARLNAHWLYGALAAYSFAVGVFWLRAKPISGRYGTRSVTWDYVVAAVAFVCFVGSAAAATW